MTVVGRFTGSDRGTGAPRRLRPRPARAVLVASNELARRRRRLVRTVRLQGGGPRGSRYLPAYSTSGPKVRAGVLWFAVASSALWASAVAAGALYGVVSAVAAVQAAAAWRRRGARIAIPLVAASGLLLPIAAAAGATMLGLAVLLTVLAAVIMGAVWAPDGRDRPWWAIDHAAMTLRVGLFVSLAAATPALVRLDQRNTAVMLLVLVSAYEAGDYLVGSGAAHPVEGPIAGAIGVLVTTFVLSVLEPAPWRAGQVWWLGALAAFACPVGQVAGSAVLPDGRMFAPAVRRLDSLLVFGPLSVVLTEWVF